MRACDEHSDAAGAPAKDRRPWVVIAAPRTEVAMESPLPWRTRPVQEVPLVLRAPEPAHAAR
eukprot:15476405-Alexandrium_andersonii.AAC.1